MDFKKNEYSAPREIEKIKILGAVLELPAKQRAANLAHLPRNQAKWAEMVVLLSW